MATFPSYAELSLEGFSEEPTSAVMRTETEDGFSKQAQRFSRSMVKRKISYLLIGKQKLEQFKTWVKNDIHHGADWFDWIDPVSGVSKQARIESGKVSYAPIENLFNWRASFTLETWE